MFRPYAYAIVEYRMDADGVSLSSIQKQLNDLGSQGYHIVSVDTIALDHARRMVWTLERGGEPMSGGRY